MEKLLRQKLLWSATLDQSDFAITASAAPVDSPCWLCHEIEEPCTVRGESAGTGHQSKILTPESL